jgi:hypothetical protein
LLSSPVESHPLFLVDSRCCKSSNYYHSESNAYETAQIMLPSTSLCFRTRSNRLERSHYGVIHTRMKNSVHHEGKRAYSEPFLTASDASRCTNKRPRADGRPRLAVYWRAPHLGQKATLAGISAPQEAQYLPGGGGICLGASDSASLV